MYAFLELTLKYIAYAIGLVIVLLLIYILFALILGIIPVNNSFKPAPTDSVTIYVESNGVHTDIISPAHNEIMNWRHFVDARLTLSKDTNYEYVSIGWGDKGFYLDTPSWSQLKASVAFSAMFLPTPTAMHVTFKKEVKFPNEDIRKVVISKEQYKIICDRIIASFQMKDHQVQPILRGQYGKHDVFYEANGVYNLFHTCNTWTNENLKAAGISNSLWAVDPLSVLRFLPKH